MKGIISPESLALSQFVDTLGEKVQHIQQNIIMTGD